MLLTVKEHCASLLGTLLFSLQQQAILVQRCSHRLTEKSGSFLMSCLPHLSFICGWFRLSHHSVALHVCGTLTTDPSGACKFEFLLQCLQKWQILVIFLFSMQVLNYINQTHRSWAHVKATWCLEAFDWLLDLLYGWRPITVIQKPPRGHCGDEIGEAKILWEFQIQTSSWWKPLDNGEKAEERACSTRCS